MMKQIVTLILLVLFVTPCRAQGKSRGLWACKTANEKNVFVSWRMRATDDPLHTTYKLYADDLLVGTLTDRTNIILPLDYADATFRLEVDDKDGKMIDSQEGVKCNPKLYHNILLDRPAYTIMNGDTITYTPNDASAYDMDGDGEQELILKWDPSNVNPEARATAPALIDCYKLNGTKLWRIDLGPNVLAGVRCVFLCYDLDGDGKGEMIVKTAQGSKDATGGYLHTGSAVGADHTLSSVNEAGVITNGGKEWLTCYDGATGRELATIDYWPYFDIQSNWATGGKTDGANYGHRGNWTKGCVAFLDVNGKPTPCAVTVRGIYSYSYAAAYSWDGTTLTNLWRHSSDVADEGIFSEGAHSLACGDMDNDGFDEIMVGAAALDHDGKLLWRTGLGHGDATHLGEFDPNHDGMEVFMITESTSVVYNAALISAKNGQILTGIPQTGGDTGRGLVMDCDSTYAGSELMEWSDADMFTATGTPIAPWHVGSTKSSSLNFRIYWDGDLLDEYHDRQHVDKWDSANKTWTRQATLYNYGYGASTINDSKYNCNLQCDLFGDWREEAVYWTKHDADYYLVVFTTTSASRYKLPWLRDDHTYDMAICWQNCGYNQPPHLGYSPVEYYKMLEEQQATGIQEMKATDAKAADSWYNLQGQKVLKPAKGVYIHQGKKVVRGF